MDRSLLYPVRKFSIVSLILIMSAMIVYWQLAIGISLARGFAWDEPNMMAIHSARQPWLDRLFHFATTTAEEWAALPVLAMVIYLWRRSEKITAVLLVASALIFPLISLVLKERFGRPRQELFPPLVVETTYSFPSGHTLTAMAVYGLIAVLLWQRRHRFMAILSGLWVLVVALSRVYLGAHYPSDVLASIALGTILIIIVLTIEANLKKRRSRQTAVDGHAPT
jgi:undecaprenyl-diphosphatase